MLVAVLMFWTLKHIFQKTPVTKKTLRIHDAVSRREMNSDFKDKSKNSFV